MKFGGHGELFEGMVAAVHLNGVAGQGGQVVEQAAEVVHAVPWSLSSMRIVEAESRSMPGMVVSRRSDASQGIICSSILFV